MKTKIITAIVLALVLLGVSCVEDEMYRGPANISKVEFTPSAVTTADDVTVVVTVTDLQGITSVKLQYRVNGGSQTELNMTKGSGDTYSAVIPKQADKAVVTFVVVANNEAGIPATSSEQSYTVGAAPVDFANLVLNEIDGNSKSIELYNKGTVPIPLEGVKLIKDNNDDSNPWWQGVVENGSIPADGYIVIIQNNPDNPLLSGNAGISAKKCLKFELKSAAGVSLGVFLRGDEANLGKNISDTAPKSFQRVPNGTGDWKLADPTNGSKNPDTGDPIPQE